MIRTLITDDHRALRETLVEQLEMTGQFEVMEQCASAEEALVYLTKNDNVELVLLDLWMDGMGGIEGCREIKSRWPQIRVLVLTSNQEHQAVVSCLLAGADGYVVKKSGRRELLRALDRVVSGSKFLDPEVTDSVLRQLRGEAPLPPGGGEPATHDFRPSGSDPLPILPDGSTRTPASPGRPQVLLSQREGETLDLIAAGLTNRAIGEQLGVSEKTARNYVGRVLEKLGFQRRAEAAAWAGSTGRLAARPPGQI